ncbi:MAG: hypothetical protein ABSE73_18035 [Planctomycetota bacterium]
MPKRPQPLDEKALRVSGERIERAWEGLRKHVLLGPLVFRARLHVLDYEPQVAGMFVTVSSGGDVFANPFNHPRTVAEWTFVLAHALLHLAFGHVQKARRGILWNIACDCVVNEFLNRMKIGAQPEGLLRLPPGLPNDEEKLFTIWSQDRSPPPGRTANGTAMDMALAGASKANWADIFARAIRRAARQALTSAAGDEAQLSPAQQARAWFVRNYPLLGAVLQHFRIVEDARLCARLGVRVAAVNPRRRELLLNPGWALNDAEQRYVLAHMALHAALQHFARRKGRDPFLWNAACDYCINAWLAQLPLSLSKKLCQPPGEGLLLSPQYAELRPEETYELLREREKAARKLVTFAGAGVPDILGWGEEGSEAAAQNRASGRIFLDALLRGYQLHTEAGKGALPAALLAEIRALEQPPLPWDVQLARWFDEHVPPLERVRTYARPSRRQNATPEIARPRYVSPDSEQTQRGTFGLVVDCSPALDRTLRTLALGAISAYSLSRNIPSIRLVTSGAEVLDKHMVAAEDLDAQTLQAPPAARRSALLQPAVVLLESARDFPEDAPLLFVNGTPCDKVKTGREHCFLIPEGGRLPYRTAMPVIEVQN